MRGGPAWQHGSVIFVYTSQCGHQVSWRLAGLGGPGRARSLLLRSHVAASVCADLAASHPQPSTAFISSSLGQDQTCHMQPPAQPSPASPVLITPAQAAQHLAIEWPPGPAQQPSSPPAATSWARHGHTGAGCLLYFSPPRHLPTQRCQTRASAMLSSGSWMQIQLLFTIPVWPRCSLLLLLCCSARVPACLAMWQLAAAARLRKLKVFLETFSGVREEKAW